MMMCCDVSLDVMLCCDVNCVTRYSVMQTRAHVYEYYWHVQVRVLTLYSTCVRVYVLVCCITDSIPMCAHIIVCVYIYIYIYMCVSRVRVHVRVRERGCGSARVGVRGRVRGRGKYVSASDSECIC